LVIFYSILLSGNELILAQEQDIPQEARTRGIIFIPGAFYTPETDWGLAAGLLYYFQGFGGFDRDKPSSISANIIYTLKNQKKFTVIPKIRINNSEYLLSSRISFTDYPEKYYGIGNNNSADDYTGYTSKGIEAWLNASRRIYKNLYAGLNINYINNNIIDIDDTDTRTYDFLSSFNRKEILSLGIKFTWDSRDNTFYTSKGTYLDILMEVYIKEFLSDYGFQSYLIDLRNFQSFGKDILAFQAYFHFNTSGCPFFAMPTLGGPGLLRGVVQNLYRDLNLMAFQAEYRMPLGNKISLVFFAGAGDTAGRADAFRLANLKYSAGAGIRYRLSDNGINFRLDIGYSREDFNFYLGVLEAF